MWIKQPLPGTCGWLIKVNIFSLMKVCLMRTWPILGVAAQCVTTKWSFNFLNKTYIGLTRPGLNLRQLCTESLLPIKNNSSTWQRLTKDFRSPYLSLTACRACMLSEEKETIQPGLTMWLTAVVLRRIRPTVCSLWSESLSKNLYLGTLSHMVKLGSQTT